MAYVDSYIKYAAQTAGRDKLCRFFQYGLKVVAWLLESYADNANVIKTVNSISSSLAMARKVFRIGKPIDEMVNAMKCLGLNDVLYKITLTISHISRSLYLLNDHLIWLAHVGVTYFDKQKYTRIAAKFWFAALVAALLRDFYELLTLFLNARASSGKDDDKKKKTGFISRLLFHRQDLLIDLIKNGSDLWIPSNRLGYVNFHSGIIGLCGVISTLAAVLVQTNKGLKLIPS